MLSKIPSDQDTKKAFNSGNHTINYITKDGRVFLCVADKSHKTTSCFAFLNEIQKNWNPDTGKFKSYLKKTMLKYSNSNEGDKIAEINTELEEVKGIMKDNIDKVVQRGDKLDVLDQTTVQLEQDASGFRQRATQLKNAVWWGSLRMKIIIGVAVLVIIGIIIMAICLSPTTPCSPK
uniref:V-SNARE coiled-coil homology domain-containing protein n=1 Tax=Arcella intermedia TaxID=1963864 RepID=A0A6B2LJ87_9EUKA